MLELALRNKIKISKKLIFLQFCTHLFFPIFQHDQFKKKKYLPGANSSTHLLKSPLPWDREDLIRLPQISVAAPFSWGSM